MNPADPRAAPPIVPGAIHRLAIEGRDDHGRGTAPLGRREVRVTNALPGEVVLARLLHVGRHVAVGRLERVVRPAPERVPDACPHGPVCPGCGLRTTSPARRREGKRAKVVAAVEAEGLDASLVEATVAAPAEDGWRHKAFLTARRTSRGLFLGLYEEHTHRLLGIEGCLAHAPAVERALGGVRAALRRLDPPTFDERSGEGWLRYVAVRASAATGEALVTLVATRVGGEGPAELARAIREAAPHVVGVVLNVHPARGNAPLGEAFHLLDGAPALEEVSGPFRLRVSAGSFFQVNPAVGARIHDAVRAHAALAAPGPALDLFGGVGATALRLAADGRRVTLVEAPGPAAEDARENARVAGLPVRVHAGRVEEAMATVLEDPPAVVVLNPPRSGASPGVLDALGASSASALLYVSCEPRSQARDLRRLVAQGFRLESVSPYDLMPQTPHVEALAVLRRPA